MATSIREFNVELYREHLDEASFLCEQRLTYLHDPEVNWPDLRDWEERFEAHIDALLVGGELALEVCRQQVADGDPGEQHAALRVFCRSDRKDDAIAALNTLDLADEATARAASHALRSDAPRGWRDDLLRLFQRDQPHLASVLARAIGYRRFTAETAIKSILTAKPRFENADLAWALGRVGSGGSVPLLWPLLDSDDERVCEAAAIALMRLGDDRLLQQTMLAAQTHSWARRVLAIGGNSKSVRALLNALNGNGADRTTVLGLGLLGDLSAVAPLVDLLDNDDLSEPAAAALNTITGACLQAKVFVADTFDPDELFGEEREAYEKDGTLPGRHGKPYGAWERRPLLDKRGWRSWLELNKHRFNRGRRWRMGMPYGPMALFECLRSEFTPYAVRAATYEEMVVRYGLDVPFEVDLPVSQQLRVLEKIKAWVTKESVTFEDGSWYFGRQLQD